NGEERSTERARRHDGDRSVRRGEAVNVLAFVLLLVGEGPEDGRENHARSVDPGERFVKANGASSPRFRYARSANREVGGGEIKVRGNGTQDHVYGAIRVAGIVAACSQRSNHGCHERCGGDQAELLVNLEHVRALVKQGLPLRLTPRLFGRESKIGKRGSSL